MPKLMESPPHSPIEVVTDFLHGVPIADPYRWLEDQDSSRTRAWIAEQTRYGHKYLEAFQDATHIRQRIVEFLAVETHDCLQKVGDRYFFRKRLPDQEQPCIYMRNGADGEDHLLIDPRERGTGIYRSKATAISPDGQLLLYEVKEGGERTGTFELLEIATRKRLPDFLPRGYLRGFAFAPDGKVFTTFTKPGMPTGLFTAPRTNIFSEHQPVKTRRFSLPVKARKFGSVYFPKANGSSSSYIDFLRKHSRIFILKPLDGNAELKRDFPWNRLFPWPTVA